MQKHSGQRPARSGERLLQWRARAAAVLDSLPLTIVAVVLTLLILFMDDFRVWLAPKSADSAFASLALSIFCLFCLELALSSLVKDDYFLRFFFWLDLLVLLSLIPDIPAFWYPITGVSSDDVTSSTVAAGSSNSSASGVIKLVRLMRLVRIAKLFELCAKTKKQQDLIRAGAAAVGSGAAAGGGSAVRKGHSQVGQHLSEQTTRKVVLLVLLMLFGIPLLQPEDSQQGEEYSLRELSLLASSPSLTPEAWQQELNFTLSYYSSILYLNVSANNSFDFTYVSPSLQQYRVSELLAVSSGGVQAFFDRREESQLKGEYDIITTLVVLLLLAVGAVLFNRNNHRMVIVPIERMMATIVALQQNPLAKASLASSSAAAGSSNQQQQTAAIITAANRDSNSSSTAAAPAASSSSSALTSSAPGHASSSSTGSDDALSSGGAQQTSPPQRHGSSLAADQHNETGMLERTLEKLTGLLQVGFGEAGSKMIQKCMNLNAEGDLDPLVDGTKMLAIFGFCDIRRFTDATECFADDTQLLAFDGADFRFIGLDELQRRQHSPQPPLLASFNEQTEQIEYRPMSSPVLIKHGSHRMVDIQQRAQHGSSSSSSSSSRVSLSVTRGHTVYTRFQQQQPPQSSRRFRRAEASQLLRSGAHSHASFLCNAANGARIDGLPGQPAVLPFVSALALDTADEVEAFLELFGLWLARGSLNASGCSLCLQVQKEADIAGVDALLVRLSRVLPARSWSREQDCGPEAGCRFSIRHRDWFAFFSSQCWRQQGESLSSQRASLHITELSSTGLEAERSAACVAVASQALQQQPSSSTSAAKEADGSQLRWLLRSLNASQLRLVLSGYQRGRGGSKDGVNCIYSSFLQLRDELLTLCLHAGYSACFEQEAELWAVYYSDDSAAAQPTLSCTRDVSERCFEGRVWCVTVPPHHLVLARQVQAVDSSGAVLAASRPVLCGQCLKEDVMMYVNEIAAIVHSQVAALDGNPNKNIGDAFLLVWRLPQEMEAEDIAELQRMVGGSGRSSPSNSGRVLGVDSPANVNGAVGRSRATTTDEKERQRERDGSERGDSDAGGPLAPSSGKQSSIALSNSRPSKSILRHLTGSTFPFSSPVHSGLSGQSSPSAAFDLKQALNLLPPRHLSPALRSSVSALADKAVVSFIRVIVEINASEELKKYALNARIRQLFDDFQVELGFGLHVGWAIEGPIGSRYKIDASYLSPHVNLAETLEGTTKLFGVPLLLSGEMHSLLSPYVRAFCRKLDRVKVSGRETPIALYTFDMQHKGMEAVCRGQQPLPPLLSARQSSAPSPAAERKEMQEEKAAGSGRIASSRVPAAALQTDESPLTQPPPASGRPVAAGPLSSPSSSSTLPPGSHLPSPAALPPPSTFCSSLRAQFQLSPPEPALPYHFVRSSPISVLQQHIALDFFDYHHAGVEAYIEGDWPLARRYLERANKLMAGGDEPSRVLLSFMQEHGWTAPDTWQGYREL